MATAENKKHPEYPCTKCGMMFRRRPGGSSTCSRACAKAVERQQKAPTLTARQKKIERRKLRLLECAFGYWFLDQAKRAGTVQTYQGIMATGLHLLYELHVYRKQRYGWVTGGHGKDLFQLCHVQPLVGRDGSTGLTTPENLFTGIAKLNQQQSNKPVNSWAGASIPVSARKRKWNITEDMPRDQVLQKIADFLGPELDTFLDELDKIPQRTVKLRLAGTVFKHQGDELYEPLDRRYTKAELEALDVEVLQQLDAIQNGRTGSKKFTAANCPVDSELGVLRDELARFSDLLPGGQQRDNCRHMLKLVQVLGIYLTQTNDKQGTARSRFLQIGNATWSPLRYYCPSNPWKPSVAALDADKAMLIKSMIEAAQAALQGLDIPAQMLEARLLKRMHLNILSPAIPAPDQWSWEACGSDQQSYIENLYVSLEPTWQALLDVGLCTTVAVVDARVAVLANLDDAIEKARQDYRSQPRYTKWNVPFEGYPQWLERLPGVEDRYRAAA